MHRVYDREFHNAGLLAVKDLFDDSGNVKPFEFWSLAGIKLEKYFFWISIIDSIPKQWRQILRSDNYSQSVDIRTLVNVEKLHFKSIYYTLRSISATPPTAMTWISKYLPQDEIGNVYTLAARVKLKNKVREMQYKILNKYLVTNVLLKKMIPKVVVFAQRKEKIFDTSFSIVM